jgi:hypothetical protein
MARKLIASVLLLGLLAAAVAGVEAGTLVPGVLEPCV